MAASVFDSALYGRLFSCGEAGRLFTDSAEIRAMLLVEGALARVQGAQGIIPEMSAAAISRATMEVQIDPGALASETGVNGVSVPALVAAFRTEMSAPEHAQFAHWGATSQDIMDTALILRLRQALVLIEKSLTQALTHLADKAETHSDLPMAARTYGQYATPTSFGAVIAGWGAPILSLLEELETLRQDCLLVSLSGAAGTASALGAMAAEIRSELAAELGLADPGRSWHTDRTPILRIADWMVRVALALGKLGEDVTDMVRSDTSELRLGGAGSSSTMPQKENPVTPSLLIALGRQSTALMGALHSAAMPRQQRDGGAWFTEWMCLPQIVLCAAASANAAPPLIENMEPLPHSMAAALSSGLGMIHAEALSFALAEQMPRPDAQATVKALCREARDTSTELAALVARDFPEVDVTSLFNPTLQMGQAPREAQEFARASRALIARSS